MDTAKIPFRTKDGLEQTDREEIERLVTAIEGALEDEAPPPKKAKKAKSKTSRNKHADKKKEEIERKVGELLEVLRNWSEMRRPSSEQVKSTVELSLAARQTMRKLHTIVLRGLDDEDIMGTEEYADALFHAYETLRDVMRGEASDMADQGQQIWTPKHQEAEESESPWAVPVLFSLIIIVDMSVSSVSAQPDAAELEDVEMEGANHELESSEEWYEGEEPGGEEDVTGAGEETEIKDEQIAEGDGSATLDEVLAKDEDEHDPEAEGNAGEADDLAKNKDELFLEQDGDATGTKGEAEEEDDYDPDDHHSEEEDANGGDGDQNEEKEDAMSLPSSASDLSEPPAYDEAAQLEQEGKHLGGRSKDKVKSYELRDHPELKRRLLAGAGQPSLTPEKKYAAFGVSIADSKRTVREQRKARGKEKQTQQEKMKEKLKEKQTEKQTEKQKEKQQDEE